MRAYVQKASQDAYIYLQLEQSAHWFWQQGCEVIRFEFAEIAQGVLDDDLFHHPDEMVVRGGVETIRQALLRAGRPLPPNLDFPPSLAPWFGRRIWHTTIGAIRAQIDSDGFQPVHIKPRDQTKLFKGMVVRAFRDLIPTAGFPRELPIIAQDFVPFVSEWRASILRREILNVAHYIGDPLLFPSADVLRAGLAAFTDQPIGFAMDWGLTADSRTLLVEVNDGYSLGSYALRGRPYTSLLLARWRQLMGLPDKR